MILFWGEGFLRKLMTSLVLAAVVAFCWGWVANVALGGMTTRQYVSKISRDLYEGIMTMSGNARKTADRTARNVQTWSGPGVV